MNALAARRRHPAAIAVLLLLGLLVTGGAYSFLAPKDANAARPPPRPTPSPRARTSSSPTAPPATASTPQGTQVGPLARRRRRSLRRLPGRHRPYAARRAERPGAPEQGEVRRRRRSPPSPPTSPPSAPARPIPEEKYTTVIQPGTPENNKAIAEGGEIFRVNCAMCHNFAGAGGALTRGKYAPALEGATPRHIYEAMVTGPQSMPVFNDTNISPEAKQKVISYLKAQENADQRRWPHARQPRPGVRGALRLGVRPRHPHRLCRLARQEGRMTPRCIASITNDDRTTTR